MYVAIKKNTMYLLTTHCIALFLIVITHKSLLTSESFAEAHNRESPASAQKECQQLRKSTKKLWSIFAARQRKSSQPVN